MNTNHTPGPWKISTGANLEGVNHRWISADGNFVADLGKVGGPCDSEANARLIASAPALLLALQRLSNATAANFTPDSALMQQLVSEARAAIAKATTS